MVRRLFLRGTWPADAAAAIRAGYRELSARAGVADLGVAVRSSATAEDLPDASFAGQQETYLNISGEDALLDACRRCYASLFTDRAISYRQTKGFDHMSVALSIGVQRMVRSDLSGSGVMFSIDTESGFDKVVLINAAWGLGENVVQGTVNPDEYQVFKPLLGDAKVVPILDKKRGDKAIKMVYGDKQRPTRNVPTSKAERASMVLSDDEILQLARWACTIEEHYGCPMDMEWAKDGITNELFIVQARPETVHSRRDATASYKTYKVANKGRVLVTGRSIGDAAVSGRICLIESARDIGKFVDGSILVTEATDPDWMPIMKRAVAIITDHGGRTSHAAIVSRELGLPAIVGTGNATYVLHSGQDVTASCAEGDVGFVYEGICDVTTQTVDLSVLPKVRTKVMLNLADPASAYRWWRLPADGIGLARMEFVVSSARVHPMALVHFDELKDAGAMREIARLTAGYDSKPDYFVDKLSHGLAALCAAVYPKPAIIRVSDFKTNEYANLVGGAQFEPKEENPMLGFRGASRYYSPLYREGFALECRAIKRVREHMGLTNAIVMIPFCRTVHEAKKVLDVMAENGLRRGENGLQVYVMCEIPSNVILAADFTEHFDGFSIGSNDLTQLTLGIDRDSGELADLFDEQDDAVKWMISRVISIARSKGCKIGLCGQAPSDHPEFAKFLVEAGIDSISVVPDSFVAVKKHVIASEHDLAVG
jgi:pyruvate,water dikinase